MKLSLNIHYLFGYVSAEYVMEALGLEMSRMKDVYSTRHLKVDLDISLLSHRQPLGELIV
jgi:hypothetical protein